MRLRILYIMMTIFVVAAAFMGCSDHDDIVMDVENGEKIEFSFFIPAPATAGGQSGNTRGATWAESYNSEEAIAEQESRIETLDVLVFDPVSDKKLCAFGDIMITAQRDGSNRLTGYSCDASISKSVWENAIKKADNTNLDKVTLIFLANKDKNGNNGKIDLNTINTYSDLQNVKARPNIQIQQNTDVVTRFTESVWSNFAMTMWGIHQLSTNDIRPSKIRHNLGEVTLLRAWAKLRFVFGELFKDYEIYGYTNTNPEGEGKLKGTIALHRGNKDYKITPSFSAGQTLGTVTDVKALDQEGVFNDYAMNGAGPIAFRSYTNSAGERVFETYLAEVKGNNNQYVKFDLKHKDPTKQHLNKISNTIDIKNDKDITYNIVRNHIYEYRILDTDINVKFTVKPWNMVETSMQWDPLAVLVPAGYKYTYNNGDVTFLDSNGQFLYIEDYTTIDKKGKARTAADEEAVLGFICRPRYFNNETSKSVTDNGKYPTYVIGNSGSSAGKINTAGATFSLEFPDVPETSNIRWKAYLEDVYPEGGVYAEVSKDFKFSTGDAQTIFKMGVDGYWERDPNTKYPIKKKRVTHGMARPNEMFEIEVQCSNSWTEYMPETNYPNATESNNANNGMKWADTFKNQTLTNWGKKVEDPVNGRLVACWFYITVSIDGGVEHKLKINPARTELVGKTPFKDGRFFAGTDTDILLVQLKAKEIAFDRLAMESPLLQQYFRDGYKK